MAYRRVLERRGLIRMTLASLFALSCTSEQIVMVEPSFIAVTPADVSAIEGERVQLVGLVHDHQNRLLEGPYLEWSSSDPTIASVDSVGLVTARSPGAVVIRARFQNVTGEAHVEVLRGPFVVVVPASVTLYTSPGAALAPQVVAVSNGGAGRLEQLAARVTHVSGADGWLAPTLSSATAPTSLTLRLDPAGLAAGHHRATVSVSSLAEVDPAQVAVVVNVAGFEVRENSTGTFVAESGTTADIGVVLSSPPSAPVVLNVIGSDPTEATVSPTSLRFTGDDWNREQWITVRGVDDIDDDGDQVSTVSVTVDGARSPDAFDVLPARTVSVSTVDDDDTPSLVVLESGGSTVVRETSTRDDFTVALGSPIVSNVGLEITTSDPGEVRVASTRYLTFTPADWNVPQTVTVVGIPDLWRDGDQWVTITIRVLDDYSDDRYDTLFATVQVRNEDAGLIG